MKGLFALILIIVGIVRVASAMRKAINAPEKKLPTFGGQQPEEDGEADEMENPIPTFHKPKPCSTNVQTSKPKAPKSAPMPFMKNNEGSSWQHHAHHSAPLQPIEVEEVNPFSVDTEDLKRGIIYSEILNRREY